MRPELECRLFSSHLLLRPPSSIDLNAWKAKGLTKASYVFALDILSNARATHVAVVRDRGHIVGWFRYRFEDGSLTALGTWVDIDYRNRGLGKKLWEKAIEGMKPTHIRVDPVSAGGTRLVESLRTTWDGIAWNLPNDRRLPKAS